MYINFNFSSLYYFVDIWGLSYMLHEDIETSIKFYNNVKIFYNRIIFNQRRPEHEYLNELEEVRDVMMKEIVMLESDNLADSEKSKRLLYLFVRDLLSGENGKILKSKQNRNKSVHNKVL